MFPILETLRAGNIKGTLLYNDEENGQPKQVMMNSKDANAPDVFYYVHINVDLDLLADLPPTESDIDNATSNLETPEEIVDANNRSIYVGQVFKAHFVCLV